jgi:hypothetical protein
MIYSLMGPLRQFQARKNEVTLSPKKGAALEMKLKDALVAGAGAVASDAWADIYSTRVSELLAGTNPDGETLTATCTEFLAHKGDGAAGIADAGIGRYQLDRFQGALS